jgi:hypothetical protein
MDLAFAIHWNKSMLLPTDAYSFHIFPVHFAQGRLDCRKASL